MLGAMCLMFSVSARWAPDLGASASVSVCGPETGMLGRVQELEVVLEEGWVETPVVGVEESERRGGPPMIPPSMENAALGSLNRLAISRADRGETALRSK
jgi:hypothetical protein